MDINGLISSASLNGQQFKQSKVITQQQQEYIEEKTFKDINHISQTTLKNDKQQDKQPQNINQKKRMLTKQYSKPFINSTSEQTNTESNNIDLMLSPWEENNKDDFQICDQEEEEVQHQILYKSKIDLYQQLQNSNMIEQNNNEQKKKFILPQHQKRTNANFPTNNSNNNVIQQVKSKPNTAFQFPSSIQRNQKQQQKQQTQNDYEISCQSSRTILNRINTQEINSPTTGKIFLLEAQSRASQSSSQFDKDESQNGQLLADKQLECQQHEQINGQQNQENNNYKIICVDNKQHLIENNFNNNKNNIIQEIKQNQKGDLSKLLQISQNKVQIQQLQQQDYSKQNNEIQNQINQQPKFIHISDTFSNAEQQRVQKRNSFSNNLVQFAQLQQLKSILTQQQDKINNSNNLNNNNINNNIYNLHQIIQDQKDVFPSQFKKNNNLNKHITNSTKSRQTPLSLSCHYQDQKNKNNNNNYFTEQPFNDELIIKQNYQNQTGYSQFPTFNSSQYQYKSHNNHNNIFENKIEQLKLNNKQTKQNQEFQPNFTNFKYPFDSFKKQPSLTSRYSMNKSHSNQFDRNHINKYQSDQKFIDSLEISNHKNLTQIKMIQDLSNFKKVFPDKSLNYFKINQSPLKHTKSYQIEQIELGNEESQNVQIINQQKINSNNVKSFNLKQKRLSQEITLRNKNLQNQYPDNITPYQINNQNMDKYIQPEKEQQNKNGQILRLSDQSLSRLNNKAIPINKCLTERTYNKNFKQFSFPNLLDGNDSTSLKEQQDLQQQPIIKKPKLHLNQNLLKHQQHLNEKKQKIYDEEKKNYFIEVEIQKQFKKVLKNMINDTHQKINNFQEKSQILLNHRNTNNNNNQQSMFKTQYSCSLEFQPS